MIEERKNGQFVVPGKKLGVIEEFISKDGTYVKDGIIYSKNIGYILMDFANKNVSVYPVVSNLNVPKVGSIVVGSITNLQSSQAFIRINKVGNKFITGYFTGILHISDLSFKYTERMFESVKVGDIIRARVISKKNKRIHLTTKDEGLGVINSYCSQCGNILSIRGKELKCDSCNNFEKRKTASDYGKGVL
jgi:exosome complex component CSL4